MVSIAKIRAEGLERSHVWSMVDTLATVIGPRLTASPAYLRAANWARDHFTGWGLRDVHVESFPFGRGWELQRFTLEMTEPRYTPLIGYPDAWRDYAGLEIRPDDAYGNYNRAQEWEYRYQLAKLGKAPDRGEWWMVPQVVNALNIPLQNALNFPAAILEPPFYHPGADMAANYGAIGAVIGHEISHSCVNLGSTFDIQ
jgi:hypothetical protein